MMKGTTYLLLWILQQCIPIADSQSCWKSTVEHGQQVQTVQITHPKGISVSWDNIRGSSNLTLIYTKDISITSQYSDGTLQVTVTTSKSSGGISALDKHIGFMTTFLIFICCYFTTNRFGLSIVFLIISATVVFTFPSDCSKPHIHVEVPFKYTEKICINQQKCFPTKCKLLLSSTITYSEIPSNNRILFEDNYCKIKKPEFWDEWSLLKLGFNGTAETLYLLDLDGDGLVNLVEYYGDLNLFNQSSPTSTGNRTRRRRDVVQVSSIGTDPKNPDSDGDLLLDGFEYFNEMSPVKADDSNADFDSDGLSNIREQILNTNPKNPDTDGDGVDDGTEVSKGSDPNDAGDRGEKDQSLQTGTIKLTIGDHSGSHSERYVMNIGEIKHQSPGFGIVGTGIYTFSVGRYPITVQHIASRYSTPDYDYVAAVTVVQIAGDAKVRVEDPSRLLGYHDESNYDYTVGKSAQLIVESNCPNDTEKRECHCKTDCVTCTNTEFCIWKSSLCRKKRSYESSDTCPCKKCKSWYDKERIDTKWLRDLNTNFKCPCKVTLGLLYQVSPVDNPSDVLWVTDPACTSTYCSKYHPGAAGCIRSLSSSDYGAGQQCCYYPSGDIIPAGNPAAGTPDKGHSRYWIFGSHYADDVDPYEWCCTDCKLPSHCDYYIKNVRKGDTSHCT